MGGMKVSNMDFIKLLPAFMQDDEAAIALSKAVNKLIGEPGKRLATIRTWDKVDELTEAECNEMAWELDIDWYDSEGMSLTEKRNTIKLAQQIKRKRGTKWAVERLIGAYFGDKKRSYHKVQTQKRAPKGESIEKRPEIIGERSTFGHWEMDTVVSARPGKAAILVLTERLTRNEITAKLPDKSAASVVQALDDLEKEWGELFPRVFQTITVDNGSEFADCPGIERSILAEGSRTKCYYCHPYSSYERGSNENLNKMIRRWLPKGTNFDEIGAEVIQTITNWLNNYPRKILGFLPASAVFQEQMDALLGA